MTLECPRCGYRHEGDVQTNYCPVCDLPFQTGGRK